MPHLELQKTEDTKHTQTTIVIVEDDNSIGLFLTLAFSEETPYRSILVPTAERALKVIESVKPDLFILDYQLPEMDGLQLCHELRMQQDFCETPIILMSANLPHGAFAHLKVTGVAKPFDLDELLDTVDRLLDQ
ncbi:response regulator [Dictyobacter aurantiacus]|uniref:Response regulator n=1 Tax=Dictyobacter aurantiacus TaxID=1936993 RepID=A0A401ZP26_9CHLR|nr:response regulator [Dictyobacter aurantiacus]GCE08611.1 response regulator [Dictyobacter aurantiacus]